jgi:hypothetical protein
MSVRLNGRTILREVIEMSNVIEFQGKVEQRGGLQANEEQGEHLYVIELEHENLDLKNTLAQMAVDLFLCRQRLGEVPS